MCDLGCEFYPNELQHSGPVIHVFHSPICNCNCISSVLIFLLDTFSLSPQAHFPLLDRMWKDNTEPHAAARVAPPGKISFQSERAISGQN